jgi:hypothetical protein
MYMKNSSNELFQKMGVRYCEFNSAALDMKNFLHELMQNSSFKDDYSMKVLLDCYNCIIDADLKLERVHEITALRTE